MQEKLLNDAQMELLWRNVDMHKGKNSQWITNPDQAYDEMCAEWKAAQLWNEDKPISQKQLARLFVNMGHRFCYETRSKYDLYEHGSILLRSCDRRSSDQEVAGSGQAANTSEGRNVAQVAFPHSKRRKISSKMPQTSRRIVSNATEDALRRSPRDPSTESSNIFRLGHETPPPLSKPLGQELRKFHTLIQRGHTTLLPDDSRVHGLFYETTNAVRSAVTNFMRTTGYDGGRRTIFWDGILSRDCRPLLERMFGDVLSPGELHRRISDIESEPMESGIIFSDALRALIGVALFEWVFRIRYLAEPSDLVFSNHAPQNERQESARPTLFPFQSRKQHDILMDVITKDFPDIFQRLLHERTSRLAEKDFDPPTHAEGLARRLSQALQSFIEENLRLVLDERMEKAWIDDLQKVFVHALKLKALTAPHRDAFSFMWPQAGDEFDPAHMNAFGRDGQNASGGTVIFALYPELLRSDGRSEADVHVSTTVDVGRSMVSVCEAIVMRKPPSPPVVG
ncbi:MAG: hypothetical protein Q9213_005088 [Squamulea squamosa]